MKSLILQFRDSLYDLEKIIKKTSFYPEVNNLEKELHPSYKAIIEGSLDYKGLPIIIEFEGLIVVLVGQYQRGDRALLCSHPQFKKTKIGLK